FSAVDVICKRWGVRLTQIERNSLTSVIQPIQNSPHTVLISQPQTYMNLSGRYIYIYIYIIIINIYSIVLIYILRAVRALTDLYKVPHKNVIVIYDDINVPLGTIRIRNRGETAG